MIQFLALFNLDGEEVRASRPGVKHVTRLAGSSAGFSVAPAGS